MDEKKLVTFENGCLMVYAMAASGYYNQEFFESVFANFIGQDQYEKMTMIIGLNKSTDN